MGVCVSNKRGTAGSGRAVASAPGGAYRRRDPRASALYQCAVRHAPELKAGGMVALFCFSLLLQAQDPVMEMVADDELVSGSCLHPAGEVKMRQGNSGNLRQFPLQFAVRSGAQDAIVVRPALRGPRARAVLSLGLLAAALSPSDSERVFDTLLQGEGRSFPLAIELIAKASLWNWIKPGAGDSILLNTNHQWLDYRSYAAQLCWLGVRPVFVI